MTLDAVADIAQILTGGVSLIVAGLAIRASRQISLQQQAVALGASRAYISPEPAKLNQLAIGKPVELTLGAKNWGQTPALRTRVTARVYLAPSGQNHMRGIPLKVEAHKSEIVVPPQQVLQLERVGHDSPPVTAEQLEQVKTGKTVLFCEFVVEYYDVAGGKHETFIRYFLDHAHLSQEPFPFLSFGKDALVMC